MTGPVAVAVGGSFEVDLVDERGRRCSLREVGGRPVLLAFAAAATPFADGGDERAWRAALRGLGAALIVVAGDELRLLQPDDPIAHLTASVDAATLRRQLAADDALTLLVLDGDGAVAWRHDCAQPLADVDGWLLQALHQAAEARAAAAASSLPVYASRREFLLSSLVAALALALADRPALARPPAAAHATVRTQLQVNGQSHLLELDARATLLDTLRETLGLTGTKKGCDHGQCGACTVLVGQRRINSCLTLAVMHDGEPITTIEGLAQGSELHQMQAAFLAEDAFQCGYCTPGQILSAVALVGEGHAHSATEIREQMSGNLCRCGAYPNIVAAIKSVLGG